MRTLYAVLLIFIFTACQNSDTFEVETIEYLSSETSKELGLPFSDAVRVGNTLYLSGQVGNIPGEMTLAEGGLEAEARQALENMKSVLEANGSSMDQVVKVTVMLEDISEWSAFNEVYKEFFTNNYPARSAFGTDGLALGARLEVECIATVK
jgi:reactive intermediate/imine deaminase